MITILPEFFLCSSLLILLIAGSILGFSSKYNYPILSYKEFTTLILLWVFFLLRMENIANITAYFVVDNLSSYSKIFITLALLFCINLESTKKKKTFEYYVLTLTGLLGLFFLSSSTDLLSVYLSLELTTFSFYILALSQRTSAFSVEAALKYFILGALSSALLVFGISLVYGLTGTTNLKFHVILNLFNTNSTLFTIIQFSFLCVSFGLLFKLGCVPFHIWLPDVYEGAPTSVTAIFSMLPKIAIFSVFIRLLIATKFVIWVFYLTTFAFLSIFIGSFHALAQTKTKRLLAFSGISHVGYALLGLACGTLEGFSGGLFYILIYITTAGFLWGLSLCVDLSRGRTLYLTDFIQWVKTNPSLGFIAVLVIFSLAGIPPFAGFFAKFNIFLACIEVSLYLPVMIGLLSSAIGIMYYLRLIKIISFEEIYWKRARKLERAHILGIGILGFFLIFFGFWGNLVNLIVNYIVLGINLM
ncbi:MAG TPA: NADH-quinone oxidoreductase subunit N [Flavobacterium sp.]